LLRSTGGELDSKGGELRRKGTKTSYRDRDLSAFGGSESAEAAKDEASTAGAKRPLFEQKGEKRVKQSAVAGEGGGKRKGTGEGGGEVATKKKANPEGDFQCLQISWDQGLFVTRISSPKRGFSREHCVEGDSRKQA